MKQIIAVGLLACLGYAGNGEIKRIEVHPQLAGNPQVQKEVKAMKKAGNIHTIKAEDLAKRDDGGCGMTYNFGGYKGEYWQEMKTCKMRWAQATKTKHIPYYKAYIYGVDYGALDNGAYTKVRIWRERPCMFLDKSEYDRVNWRKIDDHTVEVAVVVKGHPDIMYGVKGGEMVPSENPNNPDKAWLVIGNNWTCSEVPNVEKWTVYQRKKKSDRWKQVAKGTFYLDP